MCSGWHNCQDPVIFIAAASHGDKPKRKLQQEKLEIEVAPSVQHRGGSGLWESMAATHSPSKHESIFGCLNAVAALAKGSLFASPAHGALCVLAQLSRSSHFHRSCITWR